MIYKTARIFAIWMISILYRRKIKMKLKLFEKNNCLPIKLCNILRIFEIKVFFTYYYATAFNSLLTVFNSNFVDWNKIIFEIKILFGKVNRDNGFKTYEGSNRRSIVQRYHFRYPFIIIIKVRQRSQNNRFRHENPFISFRQRFCFRSNWFFKNFRKVSQAADFSHFLSIYCFPNAAANWA